MLIKYLIFCLGAALIQGGFIRQPGAGGVNPGDAPEWFSNPSGKIIIPLLAIISFIAEIILGFVLISWWAGLFLWLPALLIASIFIPGSKLAPKNPAIPFYIGIIIVVISVILFLV